MYADDILLIKPVRVTNDYIKFCLQRDITAIEKSIDDLHLSINSMKCKYIIATKKKPHLLSRGLELGGNIIGQVERCRYLGVLVNNVYHGQNVSYKNI